MSNAIAPLAGLQNADPVALAGVRAGVNSGGDAATVEPAAAQALPRANPVFHIDDALGLLVIEFRDGTGKVTSTIPTSQQLDAYRRSSGQATGIPSPPATATGSATVTTGTIARAVTNVASAAPVIA
jgi:hypothetical protein